MAANGKIDWYGIDSMRRGLASGLTFGLSDVCDTVGHWVTDSKGDFEDAKYRMAERNYEGNFGYSEMKRLGIVADSLVGVYFLGRGGLHLERAEGVDSFHANAQSQMVQTIGYALKSYVLPIGAGIFRWSNYHPEEDGAPVAPYYDRIPTNGMQK